MVCFTVVHAAETHRSKVLLCFTVSKMDSGCQLRWRLFHYEQGVQMKASSRPASVRRKQMLPREQRVSVETVKAAVTWGWP